MKPDRPVVAPATIKVVLATMMVARATITALAAITMIAGVIIVVAGCDSSLSATLQLTRAPTFTPLPTSTPIPDDTGWRIVRAGIEYRELHVSIEARSDRLHIARVDPKQVRFRVLYDPNQPRRVGEWLESTRSTLVVNGNYFDPQNHALGLIISNGEKSGQVYQGFGGMFVVKGDDVKVRWNVAQPYVEGEGLTDAMQNFPMLVIPGGVPNLEIDDNQQLAPRTAVAQDQSGRILFVVSPALTFTLTDFGKWLAASDLEIDAALNLDGGTSTGLLVRDDDHTLGTDSWISVPSVIAVEAK